MALLAEPFEFLDLEHGNKIVLSINSYVPGEAVIHPTTPSPRQIRIFMDQNKLTSPPPAGTPIGILVPVLRIFGRRLDRSEMATYWDISSKRLQADLKPLLDRSRGIPITITLEANGHRPTKRFSIEVG